MSSNPFDVKPVRTREEAAGVMYDALLNSETKLSFNECKYLAKNGKRCIIGTLMSEEQLKFLKNQGLNVVDVGTIHGLFKKMYGIQDAMKCIGLTDHTARNIQTCFDTGSYIDPHIGEKIKQTALVIEKETGVPIPEALSNLFPKEHWV